MGSFGKVTFSSNWKGGLPSSFPESNKTGLCNVQHSEAVMQPIDLPFRD
jgi:hypothetical protein